MQIIRLVYPENQTSIEVHVIELENWQKPTAILEN